MGKCCREDKVVFGGGLPSPFIITHQKRNGDYGWYSDRGILLCVFSETRKIHRPAFYNVIPLGFHEGRPWQSAFISQIVSSRLQRESPKLRMALTNARSLVNKTFICNDFIVSNDLNFFFVTESWIKSGDLSPFSELVPPDFAFF